MAAPSFRQLLARHDGSNPLLVPGATHAFMAKLIQDAGYEALYVSGAGTAATIFGLPDVGLMTMTELVENVSRINDATNIAIFADADQGFGNAVNVIRTVREYEKAGAGAIQIEDQSFPKKCGHMDGKSVVPLAEMVGKIRAACDARTDPETVIVARTDARATEDMDRAVRRAVAYAEAGAEVIFPEAMRTEEEFAQMAQELKGVPLVANMTEWGKSPVVDAQSLGEMGYTVVIFPSAPMRAAQQAIVDVLTELRERGTQRGLLDRMYHRKELYRLVGLDDIYAAEERYIPAPTPDAAGN
ncbi:methylisocitrate lyase [Micromonospora profundi]|uniref:isocitrate lyase/PEP mutase family protein n=1 Tax=Micromonospora profundi TaxID=1420889 RepID=UPI00143B61E6|nr:isocitrate lyase/phosphoenolpyruvate mutase family protein [Micromonospora profundi]NJC12972.1 methylisocitrate lyase [Micromonospora profundi]